MLLNKSFNQQVHELASKLVLTLTDLKKGSENHELCMQYALSNFSNHRFLSSDSHKIHKQVIGLVEKFLIHSQPEKSKILRRSYEEFLKNDISKTSFSKSSVHYDMIDILLHLSAHPLGEKYKKDSVASLINHKDDFDWAAHLLEDEDIPGNWNWDESPYESDNDVLNQAVDTEKVTSNEIKDKSVHRSSQFHPSDTSNVKFDSLEKYWNSTNASKKPTFICSLDSPHCILQNRANIYEINIMREILWLLSGHSDLFVFPLKNGLYTVSSKAHLSHLSNKSLQNALSMFARSGDIVVKLRRFSYSIELQKSSTYEAFAFSLSSYLEWLMRDVVTLEKKIKCQDQIFLIQDLQKELYDHIQILFLLKNVFSYSIDIDKDDEPNFVKASRLLSVLYTTLHDESTILKQSNGHNIELTTVDIIYNLWLDSVVSYLEIIDKWLCKGVLDDPKSEFIIQRKSTYKDCQHANFWNEALVPAIDNIDTVCPWLSSMLQAIVTGGKSMEILQTLSALRPNERKSLKFVSSDQDVFAQSLYEGFLYRLGIKECQDSFDSHEIKNVKKEASNMDLLQKSFHQLLSPSTPPVKSLDRRMTKHFTSIKPLPVLILRSLLPVIESKSNFSNQQLVKVLMQEYNLKETLNRFHNFQLMAWGDVMHHFVMGVCSSLLTDNSILNDLVGINILMQECVSERDFDDRVFVYLKPKSNKEKKDGGLLITSKKTVENTRKHHSIDATNCIELQWKVDWPLNLVLSKTSVDTYNKVFSYLLQIKRAVFSVESLKFATIYEASSSARQQISPGVLPDFKPMSRDEKRHRMALLRARLLHLLQHWHGFVMTSVVHAEKHVFEKKLCEAKTLDEILTTHRRFLDRICSLSLLDGKNQASKLVQETLKKIMNLAITYNRLWNCGIDLVPDKSLLNHESTFHECSEFLGRILKTIANRGSIPILDSLAYSVLS